MTREWSNFKELDERICGQVKFGDGSTVQIKEKGSILFQCKNGKQWLLLEVYYIPNLCNNIISLGQLTEDGSKVVLRGAFLWVYDRNEKLLMKVKRSNNRMYKILLETCSPKRLAASLDDPAWLWHTRLGHLNFQALKLMSKKEMVVELLEINHPKQLCEGYLVAKQTRIPFPPQASYRAERPLQLVHTDICGLITP